MNDKFHEIFYDEILCKDIRVMIEMLSSLSNSYRLLVGAAEEFSRMALVNKHDAKDAIDRADELGDVIDDIEHELERLVQLFLRELSNKTEMQQIYRSKQALAEDLKINNREAIADLDKK